MSNQALSLPSANFFSHFSDVLEDDEHPQHPKVDFDFEGLGDWPSSDRAEIETEFRRQLARLLRCVAEFLVEDGQAKVEGAGIRAFVLAWAASPRFAGLSQVQLAQMLGKHKQSIGRAVTLFRDRFNWTGARMQCDEARASCRLRERKKAVLAARANGEGKGLAAGTSDSSDAREDLAGRAVPTKGKAI